MSIQGNVNQLIGIGAFLAGQSPLAEASKQKSAQKKAIEAQDVEKDSLVKTAENLSKNPELIDLDVKGFIAEKTEDLLKRRIATLSSMGKDVTTDLSQLAAIQKRNRMIKQAQDLQNSRMGGKK